MTQSQSNDDQRLHIAMITEGTYPFHFGGVSTWCHLLLSDLSHVDFTLISLSGGPDAELQFPLPPNVVDFRPIPLWGVREVIENRSLLSLPELLDAKARTSEQVITQEFIPRFQSFLHELYADKADLQHLAKSIHGMYHFFLTHDFDSALRSKAAWECFLAETQEFFPRVAAQYGYPGAAYSLADIGRAMQWLYHWLFPLAKQLPQADIAHIAMAGLCTLIATAMKLEYGTPLMLTEHGIYLRESYLAQAASLFGLFHKVFNLRFALRMTELSYQIADMISPCCDYNQRWELRKGARPEQIQTIYYGVDGSVFTPADKPFADPAVICWVGRIDPLKDLFTLLRAAAIVQQSRPEVRFRLFGSAPAGNEGYYAKCLALRAELGLEETVIFAGFRSNAASAFNEGDIVVLSSVSEAFPFSLLEAMLCQKPVVATAVGGVPEQIAGCGFAVEPRNPQEIAEAILTLINDPELAASFGRAGREKAMQEYSVHQSGSTHEAAYRDLLSRRVIQSQLRISDGQTAIGLVAPAVDGWADDLVALPVKTDVPVLSDGASASAATPRQLSTEMVRTWVTAPNGGHNGHNGTTNQVPAESMAATPPNGHGAPSNGHGMPVPLNALSWRFQNPNGIAALVEDVAERDPLPIDGLEVTALLESMGITDTVALQRYGAPNAFDLGDEVLFQTRIHRPPSVSTAGPRALPPAPPVRWVEAFGDYARGPLALVTALSVMLIISAYSLLGGWDVYRLLALSAGLTSAMLVTSGLTQAPGLRTSTYLGLGNPRAAGHFFWLAMLVAGACVGLVAVALALVLLWLGTRLTWFTSQDKLTFLWAFVGLSAIWLMSGGLSLLRKTEWLTIGLLAGLVAGILSDRIAAQITAAHVAVGTAVGFAVVMLLVVQALYRGFHGWTPPDATPTQGAHNAPAAKQARPQSAKKTRLPPVSYLVYEAAPYFLYSALYMLFIIIPHVFGWLGVLEPGQPRLWAVTSVEAGLTLALVPIILVGGVTEHTLREFWRFAPQAQANTPGTDVSQFWHALTRFYGRYWRLYMLVLTALSVAVFGAVSMAFRSGLIERWIALPDSTQIMRFFVAGLCINWLIGAGLFNCVFCITLGRPWLAVRAVALAIAVTVIVGAPLSFLLNFSLATVAFICGAIAFALASQRAKSSRVEVV